MAIKPLGNLSEVKMEDAPEVKPPYMSATEAEAAAGRARVEFHEGREKLLAAKRLSDGLEENAVAEATKANSDL